MSTLEELGIGGEEEKIEVPAEVPEEMDSRIPLIQPGKYVLQLPQDMSTIWGSFETKKGQTRIYASFSRDYTLTVVGEGEYKDHPLAASINNYLIQALEANLPEDEQSLKGLTSNKAFHDALVKYAGAKFRAELSWSAYCHPGQPMYVTQEDPETGVLRAIKQENTEGCGANVTSYGPEKWDAVNKKGRIPKENGRYMEAFDEYLVHGDYDNGCPARLFSKPRLNRFKPFA
jgi:hypothetical protein